MRSAPIGIVMVNDGRPHVYSANEEENMQVVKRWAEVIKKNLKNIDGSSPEIVVASETIKSVRTAQKIAEELTRANCKQIVMCYNVWDFPYLAWPFLNSLSSNVPILSLSNNNAQYPGNVGLLATDGEIRQTGRRTHRIVGDIDDPKVQEKVIKWLRASQAVTSMRGEVYGLYGGHSMGMETGYFHLVPNINAFGVTAYQIDQLLLVKVMEEIEDKEVERGFQWFTELLGNRILYDGKMLTPQTLKTQIRLYLAMKKVNEENGFDFCGLKGQRELTEYVCLGDIPEMVMNDPYDWYGFKEPTVCATEADSSAALTMEILKYISGGLPVLFMDVRIYYPDKDVWDFCNSGNHASYYASLSLDPKENFKKITLYPALEYYFKAGGASVSFDAAPTKLTFARLGLYDNKPYMVIVPGENLDLPEEERKAINNLSNPTWPHVHARLECSFEEFLNVFPANHIQAIPGDYVDTLVYYCEILGIKPIVLGPRGKERLTPLWEILE
jgi:L-fucose isomerase